jgi:hypothetical protein
VHILEPSLAIDDKFRHTVVMLKNGNSYVGLLQEEDEQQVRLASGATPDDVARPHSPRGARGVEGSCGPTIFARLLRRGRNAGVRAGIVDRELAKL